MLSQILVRCARLRSLPRCFVPAADKKFTWLIAGLALLSCASAGLTQPAATASINIQTDQPGVSISSNLFGIFFEEINFGGDGGLYGELIRNRSFEESSDAVYWTTLMTGTAAGTVTTDTSNPLNTNNARSLKLTMQSGAGSIGAANAGYWGIALESGANYNLSLYASAAAGFQGPLSVRLESSDGSQTYAQTSFNSLTTDWQRFTATLTSSVTDPSARLVVSIAEPASVRVDVVSLFPQATFYNRTNGMRADIAGMLQELHPSFMRYPGGNFVESHYVTNAVRWKKTIGDVARRPGHLNDSWGYWSTDGFGLDEFLQLCEDLGAAPLYGINCGLMLNYNGDPNNTVPLDQMGPWVQDALDLIQYCNGDTNTTWGAVRAANGHPAPFNLQYIEIGNENGGGYYNDRYALFYDAIKSNDPDIKIIANNWGGVPNSRPLEIVDEHYYSSPATFRSYATKYDSYSRSGPKIFVGEYAVTSGYGTLGNVAAALGEAAFMTGMERNADIVEMASYAPLFANVNGIQWHPDLIYYDSHRVVGTPSYYVQKMFSNNRGRVVLPASVTVSNSPIVVQQHGAIGLGSWRTSVQYTNIVVTSNGVTLYQSDFVNQGDTGWQVYNGNWSVNNGVYRQTSSSATDCRSTTGDTDWANYTITLRARKVSGSEGFLILFNWQDDNNWYWWNIGGWNNTLQGIEQRLNGGMSILGTRTSQVIQSDQWYDIRIELSPTNVLCYLDGELKQNLPYSNPTAAFTVSTSLIPASGDSGEVVLKAVNANGGDVDANIAVNGVNSVSPDATLIQLSGNPGDENSLDSPMNVVPITSTITNASTNFTVRLPANSLSVLRLQASGINTITNLLLDIPSSINSSESVSATVWGEKPGGTVNLSGNYALNFASTDPNIAQVDAAGNVVGVHSGTTTITVTYPGLGLSATQSVQVIAVPTVLVHRYGFNESSGTMVADSVGGPAWYGTLPNGGTFDGGQLTLDSATQQYVDLPTGILSNYAAVTIEAWVTFPDQLPVNCFFFGFGNTNNGSGSGYIFCAPQAGRIAITSGNYSSEQNAYANTDFSFQTNFHFTAVFNPPAGYVALYTNGVLAAINNSVTVPLSSVNDVYNLIAKSLYSADPYPTMSLDEFRIYHGALLADEVAATEALGPDALLSTAQPEVDVLASAGNLTLSWPLASAGFVLLSRTNLVSGEWTPVSSPLPQIVGNHWQVDLSSTGTAQYFQLLK